MLVGIELNIQNLLKVYISLVCGHLKYFDNVEIGIIDLKEFLPQKGKCYLDRIKKCSKCIIVTFQLRSLQLWRLLCSHVI